MSERQCSYCGEWLPEEAFNRLRDGLQYWCRECFRAYFKARGARHVAQVNQAKRKRIAALRRYISEHFRRHPCTDCGEADGRVLEFDHVRGKARDIAEMCAEGVPLTALQAEIERCEVVCVNCHRRRTASRANWRRLDLDRPLTPGKERQKRNVLWVYRLLAESSCVDCGETDLVVLEFDHVGAKRASVLTLAHGGWSRNAIAAEIAKCEIRCCNCHRRKTRERLGRAA